MDKRDLRTSEDEWEDVKYLARFCANVIAMAEILLRLLLMLFFLILWLGCWIGLFEHCGLNPYHGLVVGLVVLVMVLWVRKRVVKGKIW